MFSPRRHLCRAFVWDIFPPLLAVFIGLGWCIWFMHSPLYTIWALALTSWIWWFWAREVWRIWRKTLCFEATSLVFFDGLMHREVQFSEMVRVKVYFSSGSFHWNKSISQTIAFHFREEKDMQIWDVSDFSIRAVFRVVAELFQHADLPPADVHYSVLSTTEAGVCGEARGLGTLSLVPQERLDANEEKRTDWERRIEELQRHALFTPNLNPKENTP